MALIKANSKIVNLTLPVGTLSDLKTSIKRNHQIVRKRKT